MRFSDLEKSIKQMFREHPELKDFEPYNPPRDDKGFYLDMNEDGTYRYPRKKGESREERPRRGYDYRGE